MNSVQSFDPEIQSLIFPGKSDKSDNCKEHEHLNKIATESSFLIRLVTEGIVCQKTEINSDVSLFQELRRAIITQEPSF